MFGSSNVGTVSNKASVLIHPLHESGDPEYDAVITKFDPLVFDQAMPSVAELAPAGFAVGSEVVRVNLSGPTGAESSLMIEAASCFDSWSHGTSILICAGKATADEVGYSNSAALFGDCDNTPVLLGLQVSPDKISSDGVAATHSYVSIENAREFADANVFAAGNSPRQSPLLRSTSRRLSWWQMRIGLKAQSSSSALNIVVATSCVF